MPGASWPLRLRRRVTRGRSATTTPRQRTSHSPQRRQTQKQCDQYYDPNNSHPLTGLCCHAGSHPNCTTLAKHCENPFLQMRKLRQKRAHLFTQAHKVRGRAGLLTWILTTSPHQPCRKCFLNIDEEDPTQLGRLQGEFQTPAWCLGKKMQVCQAEQGEASSAERTARAKTWRI